MTAAERGAGPLEEYIRLRRSLEAGQAVLEPAEGGLGEAGVEERLIRRLSSRRAFVRERAAAALGYLGSARSLSALLAAFRKERDGVARLYLAIALAARSDREATAELVRSLRGSRPGYRDRVIALVCDSGEALRPMLPSLMADRDPAVASLVIRYAMLYPSPELRAYLAEAARARPELARGAARALAATYPDDLADDAYLRHRDREVARIAFEALSGLPSEENYRRLVAFAKESARSPDLAAFASSALAEMTRRTPALLGRIEGEFASAPSDADRASLAGVLSSRAEYYIAKLLSGEREQAKRIIEAILRGGRYSDAIAFLNRSRSPEIEGELLSVFRRVLGDRGDFAEACRLYLNPRSLAKLGLEPKDFDRPKRVEALERGKATALAILLAALAAAVASSIVLSCLPLGPDPGSLLQRIGRYIVGWNRMFAYYSIAINSITLILLAASFVDARRQSAAWRMKDESTLFKSGMLPSVSIIAPAYREEATIVESVTALLNLRYPDYEVIVVNDGSPDRTLNTLIERFKLEKTDAVVDQSLPTMPLRGIYRSPSYPLLTVVDKANGGKADALNAGINASRKEYFCGIDADSLLERDALLIAASLALDTEDELVAAGGNILPVNGCEVDRGVVESAAVPSDPVAGFQAVEYIRSFMGGRIGWARLGALLIVSGAFGLFKKDRVVEVGGYLASSGRFGKDTVGEDMELIVRLRRRMLELGAPHAVKYAFNAVCWTEVPRSIKILRRQRDRWHRGLIDVLYFHRKMMLNPRYGRVGTVALPYFAVFELIGPFIEAFGWLTVAAAAILGLLNAPLLLLLFAATVLLGIGVSLFSLAIAGRDGRFRGIGSIARLVGFAIAENLGFRQLASLWRIEGYFSSMRRPKGWGEMVRAGFAKRKRE